ncbi:ribonuclease P protein component [Motilimonas cestriensis]|uniref:Ribonuclease P protein component n=1 Tax=Motilimonas cestriensis TaxID=2742685 RepID=A0ABS8WH55_9GAMM|nr:ribonuclease P protein component [Motilimonas cestriensis]
MIKLSFDRELRLLTPEQFKNVFKDPIPASSPHITILAKPNGLTHPRLGLAIPKKHIKRAVGRNRIRRVVRESFRTRQHQLPAVDLVVIAKGGSGDLSNEELVKLLGKLWQRIVRRCNG